jgi:hypothetical protein
MNGQKPATPRPITSNKKVSTQPSASRPEDDYAVGARLLLQRGLIFQLQRIFTKSTTVFIMTFGLLGGHVQTANAFPQEDRSTELSELASVTSGESFWSLRILPSWSDKRIISVVGDTTDTSKPTKTTDRGITSWVINGTSFAALRNSVVNQQLLEEIDRPKLRFVAMDRERDRYVFSESTYAIDGSARLEHVAAWVASTGVVTRSSRTDKIVYKATRSPDSVLPPGVAAVFFPDRKNPIEVDVTVRQGKITGYQFRNRSDIGVRSVDVTMGRKVTSLRKPSNDQLVKLSVLEDAYEDLNAPRNLLKSSLSSLDLTGEPAQVRKRIADLSRGIDIVVARTRTGFAVIALYSGDSEKQLEEARCIDTKRSLELRVCGPEDAALLDEKFDTYADYVRWVAARASMSEEAYFWAMHNLNHNLWLYSGLRFEPSDYDDWQWFMLDTLTRARLDAN